MKQRLDKINTRIAFRIRIWHYILDSHERKTRKPEEIRRKILETVLKLSKTGLNVRPAANLKIQPEVRYEHTSLDGGFDGEETRVIAGVGVSYLY